MGERRQIRTRSWNRMPGKRCSANGIMNEFIVVDDDEVIILDYTDSSSSSKPKAPPSAGGILQTVISIDDDDDETENVHIADTNHVADEVDSDDCQFVREERVTDSFRFPKFKRKQSNGTRYGLGSETDSESEFSDCEILDREQWEEAYLKRREKAGKGKAGMNEEAGPSDLRNETNFGSGFGNRTDQHNQTSSAFARGSGKETETFSTFDTFSTFFQADEKSGKAGMNGEAGPSNLRSETNFGPSFESRTEQTFATFPIRKPDSGGKETSSSKAGMSKEANRAKRETASKQNQKRKTSAGKSFTKKVVEEEENTKSSSNGDGEPITSTSEQAKGLNNGKAPVIDIMLNREMLKETDEYKKAQEEEWESRQQQLQLQAEEAQKERKRRKLEITRKLEIERKQKEMERRQKERVEEVRETQKKDEESMNMKEKLRAEISKSLKLLELRCFNMASLLQGLGIPVGGAQPQEVHAAYKRALLKFHPDRASRGDIKQQVEAEEKFKLIARMKDKYLP